MLLKPSRAQISNKNTINSAQTARNIFFIYRHLFSKNTHPPTKIGQPNIKILDFWIILYLKIGALKK